jgi:hypothetical protein
LGNDNARRCKRELDADVAQPLAHDPSAAECQQQSNTADDRRQNNREKTECTHNTSE